jgi:Zn-dependent protease with chaperone function
MYYLIGASLLFTFLLATGIAMASMMAGTWRVLEPFFSELRPDTRARLLFGLRVSPIVISFTLILAFILPAFLLYEPSQSGETVGPKLWAVIGLAVFGIAAALFRMFGSWWRTRRLISEWSRNSVPVTMRSARMPTFRLRHPFPVFAIVGIVRPKLFIAEQVLDALEANEIAAVIGHEFGHIAAWDNLKKLAMKLCGDILILPLGRSLDRDWAEVSERAADEFAVENGSRSTALNLASALIKIARILPDNPIPEMPAVSYMVQADESLALRIRRLLALAEQESFSTDRSRRFLTPLVALIAITMIILATNGRMLESIHDISEAVLAVLQ